MVGDKPYPPPRGYVAFHSSPPLDGGHSGGCAIFCRSDLPFIQLAVQSSLQVVVVQMHLHRRFTFCCLYLPPSVPVDRADLESLIRQLPSPFVLLGDLNGRHPLWGDPVSSPRGELLASWIEDLDLVVLNDGRHTHFHVQNGTSSVIDLTLTSVDCALDFLWEVLDELHGSDHYPILVKSPHFVPLTRLLRWKLDKADWYLFREFCFFDCSVRDFPTVDGAAQFFTDLIY